MAAHKAYRFRITANNGAGSNAISIADIRMFETGGSANLAGGEITGISWSNSENTPAQDATMAFDTDITSTRWRTVFDASVKLIGKIFVVDEDLDRYSLRAPNFTPDSDANAWMPSDWTVEVSEDTTDIVDGTWTVIDTRTSEAGWTQNSSRFFQIALPIEGDLDSTELGNDTFEATNISIQGDLISTEPSIDRFLALAPITAKKAWRISILDNNTDTDDDVSASYLQFFDATTRSNVSDSNTPGTYHATEGGVGISNVFNDLGQWSASVFGFTYHIGKIFTTSVEVGAFMVKSSSIDSSFKDFDLEGSDDTTDIIDGTWQLAQSIRGEDDWLQLQERYYPQIFFLSTGDISLSELTTDSFVSLESVFLSAEVVSKRRIECTFTGDTLPDLLIPITSLTETQRRNDIDSANISLSGNFARQVTDYVIDNGRIEINYIDVLLDGSEVFTLSKSYIINSIGSGRPADGISININAIHFFSTSIQAQRITLFVVHSIETNEEGSAIITAENDRRIKPNDIITYMNIDYIIDQVVRLNTTRNTKMQLMGAKI